MHKVRSTESPIPEGGSPAPGAEPKRTGADYKQVCCLRQPGNLRFLRQPWLLWFEAILKRAGADPDWGSLLGIAQPWERPAEVACSPHRGATQGAGDLQILPILKILHCALFSGGCGRKPAPGPASGWFGKNPLASWLPGGSQGS